MKILIDKFLLLIINEYEINKIVDNFIKDFLNEPEYNKEIYENIKKDIKKITVVLEDSETICFEIEHKNTITKIKEYFEEYFPEQADFEEFDWNI